jgi:Lrp/AsnC family transcriptional regulator for asnA, asnC and gidA
MSLPNEKITFDDVDRKIIAALREDGRVALAKIAGDLGVSPGMIRMRYNRLVESGSIKIVAISNPLQMGYNTMALIGIRAEGQKLMEIAEKISSLEEVIYLIVTSGSYDIMAEVICRDRDHLLQFLTNRLYKIEGIRESETFIHLKIVKEVYF